MILLLSEEEEGKEKEERALEIVVLVVEVVCCWERECSRHSHLNNQCSSLQDRHLQLVRM
jgi:hypothetical protein